MAHTQNIANSWAAWFPHIGNNLKVIDLTDSNLVTVDSSIARRMVDLNFISLSHNPNIEKNSVVELLKTENFIDRLKFLHISNITANFKNLPLDQIIDHSNNISLIELNISNNNYSNMDLNTFLFNQVKFKTLQSFSAANNFLERCSDPLISIDTTLLPNLETLDVSYNNLTGSSCFYPIRLCHNLQTLDLSHNRIKMFHSDLVSNGLVGIFGDMTNLSYIDLSHNRITELMLSFTPYHTKLEKFDVSHNNLYSFRFLSQHKVKSSNFPLNLEVTLILFHLFLIRQFFSNLSL